MMKLTSSRFSCSFTSGLAAVLILSSQAFAAKAEETADPASGSGRKGFVAVAKKAVPCVVSISVEKTVAGSAGMPGAQEFEFNDPMDFFERFFGGQIPGQPRRQQQQRRFAQPRQFKQQGQGSGFIITKDGYILTNHHVVGDADKITVKLRDGRELTAKRIGSDSKSEVALIKIDADNLPFLELGDSAKLEIGEWVIAVGNPFGLAETLTVGVVSAKGRSGMGIADYEDMIQTDAAINPGNSGGPLMDIDGKVVGINTAIFSRDGGYMGIGFATPINMAKAIKDQLLKSGKVIRGFLGIGIQDLKGELAERFNLKEGTGILVTDVMKGSPAEKSDLKEEDVILKIDGDEVESSAAFRNRISSLSPGTTVSLTILRDGAKKTVKAVCGTLPHDLAAGTTADDDISSLGLSVQELTGELAAHLGYAGGNGVVVSNVDPSGLAAESGIETGDLITSVNRKSVKSVEEFNNALADFAKAKAILLRVKNGKGTRFVVISTK
ncbi:MAG: DegQ family serine endoprotease [bacterium]